MFAVLLLNASFEPLSVISRRRAVALLFRARVDAATDHTFPIHSPAAVLHMPSVVRLRQYVHVPRKGVVWSRRGVLQRDDYQCGYCGARAGWSAGVFLSPQDFTLDHILPRARGGANTWSNTVCACPGCNQRKGNRTPTEAGMSLLWEPLAPRVNRLFQIKDLPEAWHPYL